MGKKFHHVYFSNCGTTRFIERLCEKEIVFLMEISLNAYHIWLCFFWKFVFLGEKKTLYSPLITNSPRSRVFLEKKFQVKSPKP